MNSVESNDLEFNKHDPCCVMLNAFLVSLSKPLLRVAAVHECVPRATVVLYMEVSGLGGNKFKCFLLIFLISQWSLIKPQPVWITWEYVTKVE